RLLKLIERHSKTPTIIISGDRHFAEISKLDTPAGELFDITSSSMNQSLGALKEENPHRVGEVYPGHNFGVIEVDWEQRTASLQIRGLDGKVAREARYAWPARSESR